MCESNQPAVFRSEFRPGVFCPSQCGGSGVLPHAVVVLLPMSDQSVHSTGSVPIGATLTNLSTLHRKRHFFADPNGVPRRRRRRPSTPPAGGALHRAFCALCNGPKTTSWLRRGQLSDGTQVSVLCDSRERCLLMKQKADSRGAPRRRIELRYTSLVFARRWVRAPATGHARCFMADSCC